MQKTPSQDLFNQIEKQGLTYIDDAINSKQVENYYLDFKSTEKDDYTGERKLFASDKKNYAKAISAFGNSDGGVLVWGVKTGTADADYATAKASIKNVSNFVSLLEGFTSILTTPPHPNVTNKVIYEDEGNDTGYVITHIGKSNRRPFQVINENDFRYYIRAGSNSQPASDTFLRALFGQEPQPDTFVTFGVSPVTIDAEGEIKMQVGIILHNGGENVSKNINGYVQVGGLGMMLQINTPNEFTYYQNKISGLKIGFTAKPDFILGVEQEVQPLIMYITLKKPITSNGIQIIVLVNGANQMSHRTYKEISKDDLEKMYDSFVQDNSYDIVNAILGKEDTGVSDPSSEVRAEETT
ncbi:hypothetical protein AUJ77_03465 [Candidatus Nomurabacteria bacterium CG1_02_43_90]|uniref:Schlafen AlbA-2 domain-containing protein n=1 Tax=Candidatus Nomurabacteria bacterium CG1_02_43_90 TaxID=1805281 RepID=A0A1J4UZC1_9BACT|nr:MAG: hypothetical protein AUJ77_03465 [Candidatus Nomurabacteria bacterium CG1_02_43_90]